MRRAAAGGHRTAGAGAQLRRARGLQGESTPQRPWIVQPQPFRPIWPTSIFFCAAWFLPDMSVPVEVTILAVTERFQKHEACCEPTRFLSVRGLLQSRQQRCAAQYHPQRAAGSLWAYTVARVVLLLQGGAVRDGLNH